MVSSELERPLYRKYTLKGRNCGERRRVISEIDLTNALF